MLELQRKQAASVFSGVPTTSAIAPPPTCGGDRRRRRPRFCPRRRRFRPAITRHSARPLLIYLSRRGLDREAVATFAEFVVSRSRALATDVGYIPLPTDIANAVTVRLRERRTGSVFWAADGRPSSRGTVGAVALSAPPHDFEPWTSSFAVCLPPSANGCFLCGLWSAGAITLFLSASLLVVLVTASLQFLALDGVSPAALLFDTVWSPALGATPRFSIWPLLAGTVLVSGDRARRRPTSWLRLGSVAGGVFTHGSRSGSCDPRWPCWLGSRPWSWGSWR